MASLPDASNIIRCVYLGTYGAAKWANVFHVRFAPGPPSQADMTSLAAGLSTQWSTNIKALMNANASLTGVNIQDLTSNTGLQGSSNTVVAGTQATTATLPASVAMVVSFKIARRYRGGHPRMYLTGQIAGNVTTSTSWATAYVTSTQVAMEAWRTGVNALTYSSMPTVQLVNLSYYSGKVLRNTPTFDTITAVQVHTRVDTQRRRLGKELS